MYAESSREGRKADSGTRRRRHGHRQRFESQRRRAHILDHVLRVERAGGIKGVKEKALECSAGGIMCLCTSPTEAKTRVRLCLELGLGRGSEQVGGKARGETTINEARVHREEKSLFLFSLFGLLFAGFLSLFFLSATSTCSSLSFLSSVCFLLVFSCCFLSLRRRLPQALSFYL